MCMAQRNTLRDLVTDWTWGLKKGSSWAGGGGFTTRRRSPGSGGDLWGHAVVGAD